MREYCISKQRILGAKYKILGITLRPKREECESMKRKKEVKIRFTDDELALLNSYVSKVGYTSREKYIRSVLFENVPKEQPNVDYQKLIKEFNFIGNNLNQLVKLSHYQPLLYEETKTCLDNLNELIKTTEQTIRGVS